MMHKDNLPVLLSTAFFGPAYYFRAILHARQVMIEKHEHFIKQTFRNRCIIMAANGPMPLIVPVEHGRRPGQKITDIRIAYHTPWQRNLWKSVFSAYSNSPWFEYYADDIVPFFEKRQTFLFDLNTWITQTMLDLLRINKELSFTGDFECLETPFLNYREKISPKTEIRTFDSAYSPVPYTQVFEDKYPFIPGLSILDLLFCTGPEAAAHLK